MNKDRILQLESQLANQKLTIKLLQELIENIIKTEIDLKYKEFIRNQYNKIVTYER